jgi:uncharacterized membrane protein
MNEINSYLIKYFWGIQACLGILAAVLGMLNDDLLSVSVGWIVVLIAALGKEQRETKKL